MFLEATDDVLVRRREAARRPHPLQGAGRLLDGLHREREVLADLRSGADLVIDTTTLNVHELTDRIAEASGPRTPPGSKVSIISFGFTASRWTPTPVADMRFLPNPTGCRSCARAPAATATCRTTCSGQPARRSSSTATPRARGRRGGYLREGKRFMTVAIGCTGGKHRSVAMSEEIARRLTVAADDTRARHRDLGRE